MDKKRVEQLAALAILESGVRVKLPPPLFFRVFGKKSIDVIIHQPKLGTLLHLSKLSLSADFDFTGIDKGEIDDAHKIIRDHSRTLAKMVAVALLNSRIKIKLFTGLLSSWIMYKMTSRDILNIVMVIITMSGLEDFINSIRLMRSMRVTSPKNLSPMDQGSQKATPLA